LILRSRHCLAKTPISITDALRLDLAGIGWRTSI
jgi:hypothetical protein